MNQKIKWCFAIVAAAMALAGQFGCGSAKTVTVAAPITTPAPITTTSAPTVAAATLAASDCAKINHGIDKFNTAASSRQKFAVSEAATDLASTLTAMGAHYIGTPSSTRLTAASGAWLTVSDSAMKSTASAVNAAGAKAEALDAKLGC